MKERIQKIIAARGVASRRAVEKLILEGRVSCNGIVSALGDTADPELDVILLDGNPIPSKRKNIYILLHKPRGYVTTLSDEKGRRNVSELVADCGERVYPVGRLDMDSEGLLIFTNDGAFANYLMHPKHQINKSYRVSVRGCTDSAIEALRIIKLLDGYRISPPDVQVITRDKEYAELCITIHEGRNRQIRKMCASVGMQVLRLIRVREGTLSLGDLRPGEWRYLTQDEVTALRK